MIELKEWIDDGITIRKTNDGYVVFTIPTQHFEIKEVMVVRVILSHVKLQHHYNTMIEV